LDLSVRLGAFEFLNQLRARLGDVLPREVLEEGFQSDGRRVPLVGPQGIFKPAILRLPLSITTVPLREGRPRPYEDRDEGEGVIVYKYRGVDPEHPDNIGLRRAIATRVPVIYFFGLVPGRYEAAYPAYVIGDDPSDLSFRVQIDHTLRLSSPGDLVADDDSTARRAYVTSVVQRRLHQEGFRQRVIRAYRRACAVCRLRHEDLLEAAHILPDKHPLSEPRVSRGLSFCKIHHAAFDRNIIGVRPDLVVEVRSDIRREKDGPMLVHGIQECHGKPLVVVPAAKHLRPDPELLEIRYQQFRVAG
jgi:putative restriction endonuclease